MRKILFRGIKTETKDEWIYGYLLSDRENQTFYICEGIGSSGIEVYEHTVSQFTGLRDKNGVNIFEGDKFAGDEPGEYYEVSWNEDEAIFQINLYGYNLSYGEGSQEIYDNVVTCIDTNCFDLSALSSDVVIGNNFQ